MFLFFRRFATIFALALLAATVFSSALEIWRNGYHTLGYARTMLLVTFDEAIRFAGPALIFAAVAMLIALWGAKRRWSPHRSGALGLAVAASLLGLLRIAYLYNRFHTAVNWSWRREWHGISLPGFLWETDVLARNAAFIAGAAVLAAVAFVLFQLVLRAVPSIGRGIERLISARAALLVSAAIVLSVSTGAVLARGKAPAGPSFLVICLDTVRADHLGCYGYTRPTSPTIDTLAAEGIRFAWTMSQAEATLPSHVSLFTSQLPSGHGVWNHEYELREESVVLAEVLREAGYRTAAFVDAGHLLGLFGFTQGFDVYHDRYKHLAGSVDLGIRWLDGLEGTDRFFLFVHGYDAHTPYAPWSTYRKDFVDPAYTGGFIPEVRTVTDITWKKKTDPHYEIPLDSADVRHMVDCYDAAIRWSDDQVARMIDALRKSGRLDSTWIILLSDHGEEFMEHGSFLHEKLYHTITHVPLLVRPPDREDPGAPRGTRGVVVNDVTALIDVFPTILELAKLSSPVPLEGTSLARYLSGGENGARASERAVYSQSFQYGHLRAVTSPTYHIITSESRRDSLEVYAYRSDRLEQSPTVVALTDTVARHIGPYDPAARLLTTQLRAWMDATRSGMEGREAKRLLGSDFETLRNLGYIQ